MRRSGPVYLLSGLLLLAATASIGCQLAKAGAVASNSAQTTGRGTGLQSASAIERPVGRGADRVIRPVNEQDRVVLRGNHLPSTRLGSDIGPVAPEEPLEDVILLLRPGAERLAALKTLLADQQNGSSPRYHQWLTPEQFGARFGLSAGDLTQVTNWLARHGLHIEELPEGRQTVLFSGSAAQVEFLFHTTLRHYRVGNEVHFANAADPEVPSALAAVIEGVVSLNDFRSEGMHGYPKVAPTLTTASGYHYLAPLDFATIYNVTPLYGQGFDGRGQSIAVVARSQVNVQDVRSFRASFNLPPLDPVAVSTNHNPGIGSKDDLAEATLDAEWAGAIAPGATVLLVPSSSTGSSDGALLSAQYIVNRNLAPIISMSYALCESILGVTGNSFYQRLWQQAAAQGMTVLVAAGDSGAAGCDVPAATQATSALGVNGICSTPEATCVGGTEFDDAASPVLYWNANSDSAHGSARGYIPEVVWNESAGTSVAEASGNTLGSGLWAAGGGRSRVYVKPDWQSGPGVPADGGRDVPDIALSASAHDGYLVTLNGAVLVLNGTSVAVPSFAGLMALIEQSAGVPQGNINPTLYALARRSTNNPVWHDITSGNNTVPGLRGFAAGPGYDLASGLGSVDGQALLSGWTLALKPPVLRLGVSQAAVRLNAGSATSLLLTLGADEVFDTALTLGVNGLPPGVFARYSPVTTGVPGTSRLTISALRATRPGTASVRVFVTGSNTPETVLQSNTFTLTILPWRPIRRPPWLPW